MDPSDNRVIKSYVWHADRCFFVSTIERDSSALAAPGRYNETIVWSYDWEKRERGEMLYQLEDSRHSIEVHLRTCRTLHDHGGLPKED